ncbi:hypothetical protein [Massilia sp. GCM10023247]|uniref:hypothetical protein n=1 Tax=Massilia sp. GCM10023247 TaxID=3252643 RepID=UPI0036114293
MSDTSSCSAYYARLTVEVTIVSGKAALKPESIENLRILSILGGNLLMATRKYMKYARWGIPFVLVIAGFLSYAKWIGMSIEAPTTAGDKGLLGDSFGVLNSLFSGLGFAGVVLTIWIQQGQIKRQEQERLDEVNERRSLFNLEAALEATEQARILLRDANNDRRIWIEASRLLGHAKVLGEGVTVDCHQRVLEANKLKYRSFFSDLLANKTAAFFYGVDEALDIDSAARASSAPARRGGVMSLSETRHLEEASIYRVWEAAQWPSDFEDSVGPTFTPAEADTLMFDAQGLREYLLHKELYYSVGGDLRVRRPVVANSESN